MKSGKGLDAFWPAMAIVSLILSLFSLFDLGLVGVILILFVLLRGAYRLYHFEERKEMKGSEFFEHCLILGLFEIEKQRNEDNSA